MKKTLVLLIFIGLVSCKNEIKDREFFIEEFNWRINIPEDFEYISEREINSLRQKGLDVLEKGTGEKIEDQAKIIFWIKNGDFNDFEANYQPFDTIIDGNYNEVYKEVNEIMVESLTSQYKQLVIDTISSIEEIDSISFRKFYMKVTYPNGWVIHNHSYGQLFDRREFTASISFKNEKIGEKLLECWQNSKFEKK